MDDRLNRVWVVLRWTFGLVPIIAGVDKYFNLLTNWEQYLSPMIPRITQIAPSVFMHVVGVIEILAGILVLTRFTRWAAYIVTAWLICIALNLIVQGRFFDVAVRDLVMSVAAFSLAQLTEVRERAVVDQKSLQTSKARAIA